jgi:hypothetical protein
MVGKNTKEIFDMFLISFPLLIKMDILIVGI